VVDFVVKLKVRRHNIYVLMAVFSAEGAIRLPLLLGGINSRSTTFPPKNTVWGRWTINPVQTYHQNPRNCITMNEEYATTLLYDWLWHMVNFKTKYVSVYVHDSYSISDKQWLLSCKHCQHLKLLTM